MWRVIKHRVTNYFIKNKIINHFNFFLSSFSFSTLFISNIFHHDTTPTITMTNQNTNTYNLKQILNYSLNSHHPFIYPQLLFIWLFHSFPQNHLQLDHNFYYIFWINPTVCLFTHLQNIYFCSTDPFPIPLLVSFLCVYGLSKCVVNSIATYKTLTAIGYFQTTKDPTAHWYKNRNIVRASMKARQMVSWVFGKEDSKFRNCENLQVL